MAALSRFFAGTHNFPLRGKLCSATRPRSGRQVIKGQPCPLGLR